MLVLRSIFRLIFDHKGTIRRQAKASSLPLPLTQEGCTFFSTIWSDIVSIWDMLFTPSKCKILLSDWVGSGVYPVLEGGQLGELDGLSYLCCCISPSSHTSEKCFCERKRPNWHLWRLCDIQFTIGIRVNTAAVRSILFCCSYTWLLKANGMRGLSVFERCCPSGVDRIWWKNLVNISEVRR